MGNYSSNQTISKKKSIVLDSSSNQQARLDMSFHGDIPSQPESEPEQQPQVQREPQPGLIKQTSDHPKSVRKISNPSTPISKRLSIKVPIEEPIKPTSFRHTIQIPISDPIPIVPQSRTGSNSRFF